MHLPEKMQRTEQARGSDPANELKPVSAKRPSRMILQCNRRIDVWGPFETLDGQHRLYGMHYEEFDPTDYSVVVKLRGNLPKAWKWEIYRACRCGPLQSSPVFFESMAVAAKEGKKASHAY